MSKYVVKKDSIVLPGEHKDDTGTVVRKGNEVELDPKVAEYYLERDAIEEAGKSETKSEDEKPATTRGRGAAKPADS